MVGRPRRGTLTAGPASPRKVCPRAEYPQRGSVPRGQSGGDAQRLLVTLVPCRGQHDTSRFTTVMSWHDDDRDVGTRGHPERVRPDQQGCEAAASTGAHDKRGLGTGFAEQACRRLVLAHGRRHRDGGSQSACECGGLSQHTFRETVDLQAVLLGEIRSAGAGAVAVAHTIRSGRLRAAASPTAHRAARVAWWEPSVPTTTGPVMVTLDRVLSTVSPRNRVYRSTSGPGTARTARPPPRPTPSPTPCT